MKTFVCCIVILLSAVTLHAATVEWSKPTDFQTVYCLHVDGKGGCVIWGTCTSGWMRVLWLNKKGEEVYSALHNTINAPSFSSRGLMYSWNNSGKYETCFVDKKGRVTTLADPINNLTTTVPMLYYVENMDNKGFFLQKVPGPPFGVTIVRYSYK